MQPVIRATFPWGEHLVPWGTLTAFTGRRIPPFQPFQLLAARFTLAALLGSMNG